MHIARKTIDAIETAIKSDQGSAWRGLLRSSMGELDDAYRVGEEGFRSHLGASLMGQECARKIWYSFHWATKSNFDGRMQRLFNRGHMEEGRFVAMLRLIGVRVEQFDKNGKQFRITGSHGHYGGSGDGMGLDVPDVPAGQWSVLEFKTHNDKSFQDLVKKGVKYAKFEHWVQMQQYMRKFDIRYSLYMAVNKNDDHIHAEVNELDAATADQFIDRADKIVWLKRAPEKLGNPPSAGLFACRWCDHRPVCHLGKEPDKNCRSCVYSDPIEGHNGAWFCSHWQQVIPKDAQPLGCGNWVKHPDMG